jgi:hypothetical protein
MRSSVRPTRISARVHELTGVFCHAAERRQDYARD